MQRSRFVGALLSVTPLLFKGLDDALGLHLLAAFLLIFLVFRAIEKKHFSIVPSQWIRYHNIWE
jgi:hypothetical protein